MAYNRKIKKIELSPKLKLGVGRTSSSGNILKLSGTIFLILAFFLTVKTIYDITRSVKTASVQSDGQPQVLGAADANPSDNSPAPEDTMALYTVVQGDTIFSIAQKHGNNLSWSTLAALNNISAPFTLKPGQILRVLAK